MVHEKEGSGVLGSEGDGQKVGTSNGTGVKKREYSGIRGSRNEIARSVHDIYGVPYTKAQHIVSEVFIYISDRLAAGARVEIRGIGTFFPRPPISKEWQNKVTQAVNYIHKDKGACLDPKYLPRVFFKASKSLRRLLATEGVVQ